jgi:hypothetical protein
MYVRVYIGPMYKGKVKVKLSLQKALNAHRGVRGRGSHMAVRLSALRAGHPLPPRKIPGTHFY